MPAYIIYLPKPDHAPPYWRNCGKYVELPGSETQIK